MTRSPWTRQQLLVAFALYCRLSFGELHARNYEIIRVAGAIGRTPSALAMKLVNIASIDPEITRSGRRGLRNASANDRAMWDEMKGDWQCFAIESHHAMEELGVAPGSASQDSTKNQSEAPVGEDRVVRATTRIGQAFFRSAVLSAYNRRCCITGLSIPSLLVASHVVPWRLDKANRTNPRNGLLLSALHDRAFDAGLLTIADDMTVLVSRKHAVGDDGFFAASFKAYDRCPIHLPEKFRPDPDLLSYHREHIFQR